MMADRYPRTLSERENRAITAQAITVVYPDDLTPVQVKQVKNA